MVNSAILKLSRVTPLAPDRLLYRGVQGMSFPQELLETGAWPKGFVEFGFSSATPDKWVAIEYSGVKQCKGTECAGWLKEGFCADHQSTILEIGTGQIDRGASLKWISQFPGIFVCECVCVRARVPGMHVCMECLRLLKGASISRQ